jgi:small-conductance mechanosensitive channel
MPNARAAALFELFGVLPPRAGSLEPRAAESQMNIVVIYFVLAGLAVVAGIGSLVLGKRAKAMRWSIAVLACFALGSVWQETALRSFASREPEGMKGLILRPVPYGGGDHELGPHGAHYAKWSFVFPGISALGAALLVAVVAVAVSRPVGGVAASVSLAALAGALGYALFAIARIIAASEIFI